MSQPTILVIDNTTFTRDLVKKTLRNHFAGCNIADVNNAKRAQALMKGQVFDLIMSDAELPDMEIEEFLRWVRAEERHGETPFIMLSSRGEKEFVVKAIQAGINDFVGKPFTTEDITTKVARQLKRIGKLPQAQRNNTNAVAANAVSVLTGGRGAEPAAAEATAARAPAVRATAQLNFSGQPMPAAVAGMSLSALQCLVKRGERLPALFEPVAIALRAGDGDPVEGLSGYVHSLESFDPKPDSERIKLTIRLTESDPAKIDQLTRFIASQRS